jgi:hypothetical protein
MGRRAKNGGIPELKPDGDGIYYRELGWKPAKEPGKYRQHKFYLGSDRTEAQLRYLRLDQVWAATEKRWTKEQEPGRALWDETTLQIAKAISRGESSCRLDLPRWTVEVDSDPPTMVLPRPGSIAVISPTLERGVGVSQAKTLACASG